MKILVYNNDFVQLQINKCETGLYIELKKEGDVLGQELLNIILDDVDMKELIEYLNEGENLSTP